LKRAWHIIAVVPTTKDKTAILHGATPFAVSVVFSPRLLA
jgi:hypothetical protein